MLFAIAAFLLALLIIPVGAVFITAFRDGDGSFTLGHFATFFSTGLMRESFLNSLYVAVTSVIVAALIAVPLAYFTVRFRFRGAMLIQTLGVLPLIMPPFVGAVAMQLIFGRSGSVNLLLDELFGFTMPIMEGLNGVIFVESLHYFPFILMNLTVALRNIDGAMEEAALNLGARGWRLFSRVIFPLALPGYRRRRLAGVRQGVRRSGHAAGAGTDQHARAAGLSAHHPGRPRRSARLRDQRHHDRVLDSGAMAVDARDEGQGLFDAAEGRRRHRAAPAFEPAKRACLRLDRAGAAGRASPASGSAAAVFRKRMELFGAARRLHAGPLRDRVRGQHRHDHATRCSTAAWRRRSTSSSALPSPI